MTSAISVGSATRLRGTESVTAAWREGGKEENMTVEVAPGWRQLERMPGAEIEREREREGEGESVSELRGWDEGEEEVP